MEENITAHSYQISQKERMALNNHKPLLIWFTGLSGSGKSTIANLVEHSLSDVCNFTTPKNPSSKEYENLFLEAIG